MLLCFGHRGNYFCLGSERSLESIKLNGGVRRNLVSLVHGLTQRVAPVHSVCCRSEKLFEEELSHSPKLSTRSSNSKQKKWSCLPGANKLGIAN